jgi:outer membrane autotransporter protein
VQGTSYDGSASTQFAKLDTVGWGFLASLEGGYPFALGSSFVLEPQVQIAWQKVSFGQRNDGLGEVALGDTTGETGRLGLRGKWTIVTRGSQVWQPYVRVNAWKDWGAQANTVYSGTSTVPLLTSATRLQFGGGVTGRLNANSAVYASADYQLAVGDTNIRRDGFRGTVGFRYTW